MRRRALLPLVAVLAVLGAAVALLARTAERGADRVPPRAATQPPSPPAADDAERPALRPAPATAPPRAESAATGAVRVRVTSGGGAPAAGASVLVWGEGLRRDALAGSDGVAVVEGLPPGSFAVRVGADGHAGDEAEASVSPGETTEVDLALVRGVAFEGRVLDARSRAGVAGASVTLEARGTVHGFGSVSARGPWDRSTTDEDGAFRLVLPEAEIGTVVASADGYRTAERSLRMAGGRPSPPWVDLLLERGARVVGRVLDPEGRPVEGATVYVFPASDERLLRTPTISYWDSEGGGGTASRARSDATGAFVVAGLPNDVEHAAVADAPGFARSEPVLGLRATVRDGDAHADVRLRVPVDLVVALVDLEGRPVLHPAAVQLDEPLGGLRRTAPDGENEYRFEGVAPGEHRIHVSSTLHRDATTTFVAERGAQRIVVALDPGARVEGVAVDEDGHPVPGAIVSVGPAEQPPLPPGAYYLVDSRSAVAEVDGRFVVGGLAPGPSVVLAQRISDRDDVPWLRLPTTRVAAPRTGLRLVLSRLGTVRLSLRSVGGRPFEGFAYVGLYVEGQFLGATGAQVEGGRIALRGLEPGVTRIVVEPAHHPRFARTVDVPRGRLVDLGEVVLEPGVEVRVTVLDGSGAPVAGARVHDDRWSPTEATTDASGHATVAAVAPGEVDLTVAAEGFLPATVRVAVAGEAASVLVRLTRGARLRVRVRRPDGRTSGGAQVLATRVEAGSHDFEEETAGPDGVSEMRLAPGRWKISAPRDAAIEPVLLDLVDEEEREVELGARSR